MTLDWSGNTDNKIIKTDVIRVSELVKNYIGSKKVNLLNIDIEGGEYDIIKDFIKSFPENSFLNTYVIEISSSAINQNFFNEIKKIEPFGTGNELPIFLIKELKIIKTSVLNNKHISAILKPKIGSTIKSISFNSLNTEIGKYLLSYKKKAIR